CCLDRVLSSFPTRRSSDLEEMLAEPQAREERFGLVPGEAVQPDEIRQRAPDRLVRGEGGRRVLIELLEPHRRHAVLPLDGAVVRSEEHTSELQSRENIVCR